MAIQSLLIIPAVLAIAIGSLVDDAIVDVENVHKRLLENKQLPPEKRKSVLHVVYEASKEVRMPIFNSSLIIIASFTPLFFLSGMEGRLLIPLGIAFIVALMASYCCRPHRRARRKRRRR